jgi:hypothetical protein
VGPLGARGSAGARLRALSAAAAIMVGTVALAGCGATDPPVPGSWHLLADDSFVLSLDDAGVAHMDFGDVRGPRLCTIVGRWAVHGEVAPR